MIGVRPLLSLTRFRLSLHWLVQYWFWLLLVICFAVVSVQHAIKVMTPSRLDTYTAGAIARWKPQIEEMLTGTNIWQRYNYPNPPIMAILLTPFALLPPLGAALSWFAVKAVLAFVTIVWVFRLIETARFPFPPWAKALTALLSLRPILGDLSHGNVNLFIMFLLVGSLYAFRQRKDGLCGIALAMAIACKLTPALFVPYFLWKRAWRALAGVMVGLALFFVVIPSAFLGFQRNNESLSAWVQGMVLPFARDGFVTSDHNNQSLPGVATRLLTLAPSFSTYVDDQYTPVRYHNFLSLEPHIVKWGLKIALIGFALLVVWSCRTPTEPREVWRLSAEYGLIILGMLAFSERTWKHHCVILLIPFAVLVYGLSLPGSPPGHRRILATVLLTASLMIALTSQELLCWECDVGGTRAAGFASVERVEPTAKLAQTYGAYLGAFVALGIGLLFMLRGRAFDGDTREIGSDANGVASISKTLGR